MTSLNRRAMMTAAVGALTSGHTPARAEQSVKSKHAPQTRTFAGYQIDQATKAPLDILLAARLKAPAETVWALVGDHKRLGEWLRSISRVEILPETSKNRRFAIIATRQCTFDEKILTEDIPLYDAAGMVYAYSINKERSNIFMPLNNHLGVFSVERLANGSSLLSWRQFWDKELLGYVAAPMMKAKYMDTAMDGLIERFGGELVSVV